MRIIPGCAVMVLVMGAAGSGGAAQALGNPASLLCEAHGGRVVIETAADGGQTGICIFPDGRRIEEWTYFRAHHSPSPKPQDETPPDGNEKGRR